MELNSAPLEPGLYLVATPIGSARDITLRALDILASADVLVAEDTRSLRKLMNIHGLAVGGRPVWSYHDASGPGDRARVLDRIAAGQAVAYASEAGTPLVADPGFDLVREAGRAGLAVTAAPGPCAAIAALTLSGLPSDRFLFAGFPPAKRAARRRFLAEISHQAFTTILYESPRRLRDLLEDVADICGEMREVVMCRELTKRFEEVRRDGASAMAARLSEHPVKGEVALLIAPAAPAEADPEEVSRALFEALSKSSVRDAADIVAARFGLQRRQVYRQALDLADRGRTE